jgi:hypothetical protein
MKKERAKYVNELWRRYLLLSGTKMHTLQIPTTRILRDYMPSKPLSFLTITLIFYSLKHPK